MEQEAIKPSEAAAEDFELKIKTARAKPNSRRVFLDPATPSARSIFRVIIIVLICLAVAGFLQTVISSLTFLLFIIILSVFFAYFIEPLVRLIQSPFESRGARFMPRPLAIAAAYLVIFGGFGLAIYFLAPIVVQQAQDFSTNLPGLMSAIQAQTSKFNRNLERYRIPPQFQEEIGKKINEEISGLSESATSTVGSFALGLVSFLPWLILIPILAFFFLKDVNMYRVGILRVFPSGDWRIRIEEILTEVNSTLRAYVRAQLLACLIIGVVCTIGFYLIGLNYALLLGVLAGLFEFVPLIGPLTVGILSVTVAGFSNSPTHALVTAIFLIVLRIIHDYVTYPRIVRGGIHLHPLAIILSVLAGEQVAGIPGVFLSIPIVAIGTVLYKHFLESRGNKGIIAGILEPKKDETTARLIEDKPVGEAQIDDTLEDKQIKREDIKDIIKEAVEELKETKKG